MATLIFFGRIHSSLIFLFYYFWKNYYLSFFFLNCLLSSLEGTDVFERPGPTLEGKRRKEHTVFSLNSPMHLFYLFFKDLTADVLPVVALLFILKGLRPEL